MHDDSRALMGMAGCLKDFERSDSIEKLTSAPMVDCASGEPTHTLCSIWCRVWLPPHDTKCRSAGPGMGVRRVDESDGLVAAVAACVCVGVG
jgi:hypothetical protein